MEEVLLYNTICLVATIFLLVTCFNKYSIKAIINPFVIFLITWLPSFLVIPLFIAVNEGMYLFSPDAVVELLQFYLFNCLMIFAAINLIRVNVKRDKELIEANIPNKLFNRLSVIIFMVVAYISFFIRGFDVIQNREAGIEQAMVLMTTGKTSISNSILAILTSLLIPLIILSAKDILYKIMYGSRFELSIYKLLPFISACLGTITLGGRAPLFQYVIILGVSTMMYYTYQIPIRDLMLKGIKWFLLLVIPLNLYTTYVAEQRATQLNRGGTEQIIDNEMFKFLNGVAEYSYWHILGYQYRKADSFPISPNGLSGNTFGFVKNITFPFASQFGLSSNLGNLLEIKKAPQMEKQGAESITATVYFNLHSDLGYVGTLIAIALFTFMTQLLFRRIAIFSINDFFMLGFYILIFNLWRTSWFNNLLGQISLVSAFIPYFILGVLKSGFINTKKA